MRNLILFIAILVSSFMSAQTFDFSCEVANNAPTIQYDVPPASLAYGSPHSFTIYWNDLDDGDNLQRRIVTEFFNENSLTYSQTGDTGYADVGTCSDGPCSGYILNANYSGLERHTLYVTDGTDTVSSSFEILWVAPQITFENSSETGQDGEWIYFEISTGDVTGGQGDVSVSIEPSHASAATFSGVANGTDEIIDGLPAFITYDGNYRYWASASDVSGEGRIDYTFTAIDADGNEASFTHTIDWSEPIGPLDFEGSVSYSDRTFLGTFTGADGTTKITVTWPDGTESSTEDGQGARGADYSGTIGHSQVFTAGEYSVTLEDENTVLGPFTFTLE